MRRLFMEPIGIFILAMVCQLYSCAQNVSDSVEQMSYASVAGEEYLEGDKIETNLNNKVFLKSIPSKKFVKRLGLKT